MTATDYQACEDRVLAHEGSEYTDGVHPYDPGGPTRWGITIGDAKAYWKKDATPDDVKNMPKSVAQAIYKSKYWDALNGDQLPSGMDDCVFDYGVNSGISRSGKVLRRLLNLPDTDWHVTDQVLAECARRDSTALINAMCDERMKFLQSLAIWPTYKNGWTTRVKEVREFSLQLAQNAATPVSVPVPAPPPNPTPVPKGKVPPPPTAPIIVGGGAAAATTSGLLHWFGVHPVITGIFLAGIIILIIEVVSRIKTYFEAKQDAPTPGVPAVPVKS